MFWYWLRSKFKSQHKVMDADDPRLPKSIADVPVFMLENPPSIQRRKPHRYEDDEGIQTGIVVGMGYHEAEG